MDDIFCNNNAIEKLIKSINENKKIKWGAFGFNHNYGGNIKREIIPHMIENRQMEATSLIGCPSVSFFVNEKNFFNEEMIIINDFDMHYRLFQKYGLPFIINDISITIRIHKEQVSSILSNYKDKLKEEIQIFKKNK
jgi:hypothetical protein